MSVETHTVRIGRGQGCDLVLTHSSVSRRHAELTIGPDGSLEIRDLQSTGGTVILRNGKEHEVTTKTQLQPTDTVRLGDYEISVADLLSLIRESQPGLAPPPMPASASSTPAPPPVPASTPTASEDPGKPKTRMVRCTCGNIKERGKVCPACGT